MKALRASPWCSPPCSAPRWAPRSCFPAGQSRGTCGFGSPVRGGHAQRRARWLTAEERLRPGAGSSQNVSVFMYQLPPSPWVPGGARGVKPTLWQPGLCSPLLARQGCGNTALPAPCPRTSAGLPSPARHHDRLPGRRSMREGCSETATVPRSLLRATPAPAPAGGVRSPPPRGAGLRHQPPCARGAGGAAAPGWQAEVLNCGSGVASVSAYVCKAAWESFVGSRAAATLRHSQLGSKSCFMVRRL